MSDKTVAFAIVGVLALLGGIGAFASSFQPANVSNDITIPAGRESYIGYAFSLLVGGTASGSFAVLTGGGGASMNVMTDAQYRAWIEGRPSETLPAGSTSGSFGQFNVPLPGTDTFHLVFTHDLGYESRQQVIHVVFMVSGIGPPSVVVGGIVAQGIGTMLIALAAWRRGRETLQRPTRNLPAFSRPSWMKREPSPAPPEQLPQLPYRRTE
ncbi:MAG: hypothetical protein E6K05_04800 [Methanobacteriota archaeon]|nr:MAG: hypothetical protein E6K05_04800 [Euryarchaeota archaeon]